MSGSLTKLTINAYTDKEFKKKVPDPYFEFKVPVNPESFTKNFKVELDKRTPHGSSGVNPNFKSIGPQDFKVEFLFDGTNTIEGYVGNKTEKGVDVSVHDQLSNFMKCVYDYDGDIHKPHYLIVFWGSEIEFHCVLSNLEVNYTLFDPTGFPIRVKINATFMSYLSDKTRLAKDKVSSPDLTHYQKVQQGDRLDLMTYKIYDDSIYFQKVAYANKLTSTRNLTPGFNMNFPPLDQLDPKTTV
jgi:hypothetical protein